MEIRSTDAANAELYSCGSNAIRTGMAPNEYTLICDGNEISLQINNKKVRTIIKVKVIEHFRLRGLFALFTKQRDFVGGVRDNL